MSQSEYKSRRAVKLVPLLLQIQRVFKSLLLLEIDLVLVYCVIETVLLAQYCPVNGAAMLIAPHQQIAL